MAGPAVYRQAPEVGAGWFNDHVRICAGGAQQCAFLPRLGGEGLGNDPSYPAEYLEAEGFLYAIRLPANTVLQ